MHHRPLKPLHAFVQKINFFIALKSYSHYQPVYYQGKLTLTKDRNCFDRWQLIKNEIKSHEGRSVLDIGSAEGFYVLQSAKECGCVSLGVEPDVRRLQIAQNQLLAEKISLAGFIYGVASEESLDKLPQFDIVIFMSVMHHMMYTHSEEYCRNFLKKLRGNIGKAMIFEMGQSDEYLNAWSKQLPDMGKEPHEWIKNFLLSAGFSKVTKLGETDSYKKESSRAIFLVEP
jgi:cyclopropane fatty-acyl-phospholipid synthase-like methyltransferase